MSQGITIKGKTSTGQSVAILVDSLGQLQVGATGFQLPSYDEIEASYPDSSTEVYVYKLAGDTVLTVTVSYTDSTKAVLSGVTYV